MTYKSWPLVLLVLAILAPLAQPAGQAQPAIPAVWHVVDDGFESGSLDAWRMVSPGDLHLIGEWVAAWHDGQLVRYATDVVHTDPCGEILSWARPTAPATARGARCSLTASPSRSRASTTCG